jgi:hypothetical protein
VRLLTGARYRVDGVLHEYLGEAMVPDAGRKGHVFLRSEWRPFIEDQLPLTIVNSQDVDRLVSLPRRAGQSH